MWPLIFDLPHMAATAAQQTFWSIVESGPVLIALALGALVLRLTAILPFIPAQYRGFAVPLSWLCFAVLFFNLGHRLADQRAVDAQLKFDLAFSQTQLSNMQATASDAARLRAEAQEQVAQIQQRVEDYEKRLAEPPADKPTSPIKAVCDDRVTRAELGELRAIAKGRPAKRGRLPFIDRLRAIGR